MNRLTAAAAAVRLSPKFWLEARPANSTSISFPPALLATCFESEARNDDLRRILNFLTRRFVTPIGGGRRRRGASTEAQAWVGGCLS